METIDLLSPARTARKEKILDAAERLFSRNGFRGTTMEGIAAAVSMSKATVYAYFADKDTMFVAVADRFLLRLSQTLRDGMESDRPLPDAIADGLVAKYTTCYEVLRSSPFSGELFTTSNEMVADLQTTLNNCVEDSLHEKMVGAGIADNQARNKARLISAAVKGISDTAADYDQAVADIRSIVHAVVASESR